MFLLQQVLPSSLLALAVAAAIAGLAIFCRNERVRAAMVFFGLALGYAAGHLLITGLPKLPPADTTNWLPYLGLAAGIAGVAGLFVRSPMRWLLFGVISAGGLWLLLAPMFRDSWTGATGWLWVGCLAAGTVLVGFAINILNRSGSFKFEAPLCLLIVSAGSAGALILSGSLLLGQFALVLTGAIAGTSIVRLRHPVDPGSEIVSLLLVALLTSGYFFADLKAPAAVLLAAAPLFALMSNRISSGPIRAAVRLLLVSAPVIAALILAFRSSPPLDY
jgi:hypothetical protein